MSVLQPYVIRRLPDLKAAVAALSCHDAYVIDVETVGVPDGLNPRTNQVTWVGLGSYGELFMIPMQHPRGRLLRVERLTKLGKPSLAKNPPIVNKYFAPPGEQLMPDVVMRELEPLLFSEQTIVGHNLKFDLTTLAKYYGGRLPPGPYFDTMIANHVADENRRSYSLKEIIPDFLGVPKAERKAFYPNLGKTIPDEAIDDVARYLAKDVRFDWLLYKGLCEWLAAQNLLSVFRLEMDLYPVLMEMEMEGAAIDLDHLDEMEAWLVADLKALQERAWTIAGAPFVMTNVDDKRKLLFDPRPKGQGLRPLKFTPKRQQPVLDQNTLEHYADRNELARIFLEWSVKDKIRSTFVAGIRKRMRPGSSHPVVHTSFTQHGTVTGRLSSRDPNLQNIPRESDVRALFVAPDGYSLVVADYDQIEMRVLTHFCQDERMLSIFDHELDVHAGTVAAVLGKRIEDVTKDERQLGKNLNFAVVYGAGPRARRRHDGHQHRPGSGVPEPVLRPLPCHHPLEAQGAGPGPSQREPVAPHQRASLRHHVARETPSSPRSVLKRQRHPASGRAPGHQHQGPGHRRGDHEDRHDPGP